MKEGIRKRKGSLQMGTYSLMQLYTLGGDFFIDENNYSDGEDSLQISPFHFVSAGKI